MTPDDRGEPEPDPTIESEALSALLSWLKASGYRFITPTPATHARVLDRPGRGEARTLRDIFGWSLPFRPNLLPSDRLSELRRAGIVAPSGDGRLKSRFRVSSLGDLLFLHSAFPTDAADSVFFGPDSYRFARFIEQQAGAWPERPRIIDVGAGSGVGGVVAARLRPGAEVWLSDVNAGALRLARLNAEAADVRVRVCEGPGLSCAPGDFDVVVINPPYIIDAAGRAYRDGGGLHGGGLALDLTLEGAARLPPGGQVLLYTGEAVVEGRGELTRALEAALPAARFRFDSRERDPDVFGEELSRPEYGDVERIALIEAIVTRLR